MVISPVWLSGCVCWYSALCQCCVVGSWADDPLKHTHTERWGGSWWDIQRWSVTRSGLWLWPGRKLGVYVNTAGQSGRSGGTLTHTLDTRTHTMRGLQSSNNRQEIGEAQWAQCGALSDPQTKSHSAPLSPTETETQHHNTAADGAVNQQVHSAACSSYTKTQSLSKSLSSV